MLPSAFIALKRVLDISFDENFTESWSAGYKINLVRWSEKLWIAVKRQIGPLQTISLILQRFNWTLFYEQASFLVLYRNNAKPDFSIFQQRTPTSTV